MATYELPQRLWKRNLAGILDFVLAFCVCVYAMSKIFGNSTNVSNVCAEPIASFSFGYASFKVGGGPALLAIALIIAYFVVLSQTEGTIFQRLFSMRRARSKWFRGA